MSAALTEGTIFARRYRVVRPIAAGAMGAVYEAVHLETDRRRALKVMHPHLFQSDEMRERFKREARIAANVESEYIVDVSDAGVDEATGMPFLVMELLRGEELGQRLKRMGRLPPAEVLSYLHQTALALDRTHAASIVHRDLKPDNLFLTQREDGSMRLKILDFGVAKLVAEGATAAGATRSLGTPLYMSPEQFRPGTSLTGAADIYALGMMAYTLLVGEPYWTREAKATGDVIAFALSAIHGPKESAVQRAAAAGVTLPPAFDAWFARAAAADPAARFARATEAVRALNEALASTTGSAADAPAPTTVRLPAASAPALATPLPVGMPPGGMATSGGSRTFDPRRRQLSLQGEADLARASSPHLLTDSGAPGHASSPHLRDPGTLAAGVSASVSRSSAQALERAAQSTDAAVSAVPPARSRGPAVAVAAILSLGLLGALGTGAWWMLRSRGEPASGDGDSAQAEPLPAAATSAAPAAAVGSGDVLPANTALPVAPAVQPVVEPTASAISASSDAGPDASMPMSRGASTGPKPPASAAKPSAPSPAGRRIDDKLLDQD